MPIPSVKAAEKESEYIGRCISSIVDEYEQDQAAAICYSTWRESKNMSSSEEFRTLPQGDCEERHKSDGYPEQYIKWACSKPKQEDEAQQGGVVAQAMARTKFEFPPMAKEKMSDFMGRCMGDQMVRERKQDRINRANFCYREYQNRYVMTIGKNWK